MDPVLERGPVAHEVQGVRVGPHRGHAIIRRAGASTDG